MDSGWNTDKRFQRRLRNRLGGQVTLPFSSELWDYRALIEKKKTRRILRLMNTLTRLATTKKVFPYPTVAEQFVQDYDDSDSSYGRDESILLEGYFVVDQIYRAFPGKKIYLCQKSLFSTKARAEEIAVKVINLKKAFKDYIYNVLPIELDFILKVKHPFIIETLCVIYRRKQYFIFMRYAEKSDLFAYLVNSGRLTENRARIWSAQIAKALEYIHSLDIVHRDVCCENILITEHNNLKLTDFENAVTIEYDKGRPVPLVEYKGTVEYATPEILAGRPYHGKGADTWALGVVLYSMLTAYLPFAGSTPKELLQSQEKWAGFLEDGYSIELKVLLEKMFRFKSSRRYNLERFMSSDWFRKEEKLSSQIKIPKKARAGQGDCRPINDAERKALVDDPAQEKTRVGYPIRFQPFVESSPSTCTLIPVLYQDEQLSETYSEDLSYGVPFTPGQEHREFMQMIGNWKENREKRKGKKGN